VNSKPGSPACGDCGFGHDYESFADMLGCARGRYFGGSASELLS
jgi:hypothetical protein